MANDTATNTAHGKHLTHRIISKTDSLPAFYRGKCHLEFILESEISNDNVISLESLKPLRSDRDGATSAKAGLY